MSLAIYTKFYKDRLGAIELYFDRQNGHSFFCFAHESMHVLQKVCPHGNNMYGLLCGGRNSSKQMGHVFDMT